MKHFISEKWLNKILSSVVPNQIWLICFGLLVVGKKKKKFRKVFLSKLAAVYLSIFINFYTSSLLNKHSCLYS